MQPKAIRDRTREESVLASPNRHAWLEYRGWCNAEDGWQHDRHPGESFAIEDAVHIEVVTEGLA